MNTQTSNKKPIIIATAVVIIAAAAWYFYGAGGSLSSSSNLTASADQSGAPSVGADVLDTLRSVSSLRIETALFSSAVYQSLVDYSINVPPQSVGRPNPFAPTSGGASAAGTAR